MSILINLLHPCFLIPNCKSLWIKASAKWLNVNVNNMDNKNYFLPSSYTFPCLLRAVRSKLFSRPFWPQTYQKKQKKRIKNHTLIIQYLNIKDSHYLQVLMSCVLPDDSLKSPRRRMAAEQPESERCILMTGVLFTCRLTFYILRYMIICILCIYLLLLLYVWACSRWQNMLDCVVFTQKSPSLRETPFHPSLQITLTPTCRERQLKSKHREVI